MAVYDVIVLGTGGVGSAAAFHLAKRGQRVLGLDRFPGGHDQGSSHGQSRIIRMAYFEHPDYVPLLRRAYELWSELERQRNQRLYYEVGLLEIGPETGYVVPGVMKSARQHQLEIEVIDTSAIQSRFPGFVLPAGSSAVFERRAGFLLVEPCVLAHLAEAQRHGAEFLTGHSVVGFSAEGNSVQVQTDKATFHAAKLVVTAGAWAGKLLSDLGIPLSVRRKHLHWYRRASDTYHIDHGAPTFLYETASGCFYGFPQFDDRGVKVAEHSGGSIVADPLGDPRDVEPLDRQRVEAFLRECMPGVSPPATDHAVCYYTMSPDENFIVDRHPRHDHVCFTAGLSGHGFKFTSVLGEIMADLACSGKTRQPIEFLSCRRTSLAEKS